MPHMASCFLCDLFPHWVCGGKERSDLPFMSSCCDAGEKIGTGTGMQVDIAVDPLDGTSLVAGGRNGAVAVRLLPK
jgi:fructose-1,6-bisphosphatase II